MSGTINPNLAAFGQAAQRPIATGTPAAPNPLVGQYPAQYANWGGLRDMGPQAMSFAPAQWAAIRNPPTATAGTATAAPTSAPANPSAGFWGAPSNATGLLGLPMSFWHGVARNMQQPGMPNVGPQTLAGVTYTPPAQNTTPSVGGITTGTGTSV